ncbi:MAG: hypothetical protein JO215_03290 [Ktedonobacteraceae bacterium]|nr:hypothetical protein [Ktedonobacteraceae bacterium]MBV9711382.1 hypothetical protein [Ktedonobacteraceae bacterium]
MLYILLHCSPILFSDASALVGDNHDYLFVVVRGLDGRLYLNQGYLDSRFVG